MRRTLAIALVFCAVAAAACSSDTGALPPVPSIPALATSTTSFDFATVELRGVPPGRTVKTVPIGPGRATLSGTIIGPDGPVPEADILIERVVNDGVGTMAIKAAPDGTWSLPTVLGGRYRIRAWRSPDLALVKPSVTFVDANETRTFDLRLTRYGGVAVKAAIAPNPPPVDESATLVVLVTTRTVDDRGIVRATPVPGVSVELVGSGAWRVESTNPASSDGRGNATWTVRCRTEGRQALAVTVGDGDTYPLALPDCATPPPQPEPTDPAQTTTSGAGTTSTTRRGVKP